MINWTDGVAKACQSDLSSTILINEVNLFRFQIIFLLFTVYCSMPIGCILLNLYLINLNCVYIFSTVRSVHPLSVYMLALTH